ncbi:MAG: trehalose-phosphatase [Dermatophilaceae bacterium]
MSMSTPDRAWLPAPLQAAIDGFGRTEDVLVAVDFDGVLSEIVEQRSAARPLPASTRALERLSTAPGTRVALVSGRTLQDLVARAQPTAAMAVIASHGAETAGVDLRLNAAQVRLRDEVVTAMQTIWSRCPGTDLEVKPIGAALHTRLAERDVALHATATALLGPARLPGAHPVVGKEVVEIRVTSLTKGDAVTALQDQLHPDATLYIGDDVTDEDAFAVLGPGDVGIKVGPGPTAAQYRLPDPQSVARLLTDLADTRSTGEAP